MPNRYASQDGILQAQVFNGIIMLDDKSSGVRGRTLMVRDNSDDDRSQPSDDAGKRLACAIVE